MADFADVPTVELLTRAAGAARNAAALVAQGPRPVSAEEPGLFAAVETTIRPRSPQANDGGIPLAEARLIAASGPDHWRAVEALLQASLNRHAAVGRDDHCIYCSTKAEVVKVPCPGLGDLRPLAEQVLRDLGDSHAD